MPGDLELRTFAITGRDSGQSSASARAKAPPPSPTSTRKPFVLEPALAPVTAFFGDNRMSVAMLDVDSGAMATYGHDAFDTAGIVKADILAPL